MRNFLRWGVFVALALLVVSGLAVWSGVVPVMAQVGICLGIGLLLFAAMAMQARLDQGHEILHHLIAQAEAELAQLPPDAEPQARALVEEARAELAAAEDAPTTNIHAGPEINHISVGIEKAREALALLDKSAKN
jgi:hypothetical protein